MWSLKNLLVTLCITLRCVTGVVGLIHVTGYVDKKVNVSCAYARGYESSEKYLCKKNCENSDVLITTSKPVKRKYMIHDNKTARIFTTTISDLHSMDAGKYWCGVSRTGNDIYSEVRLKLGQDSCCDTVTKIQSYERHSVAISCPYESRYQNNLKYICKGNWPSTCLQQALITSETKQNSRFRLNNDTVLRIFTVTIGILRQNDSVLYLCGIQRNSDLDVFTAVELEVEGSALCVVYTVPPVLLLMCVLVIVYKYRCSRVEEADNTMSRNTPKAKSSEEVKCVAGSGIYGTQEAVMIYSDYEDIGGDEPHYENL